MIYEACKYRKYILKPQYIDSLTVIWEQRRSDGFYKIALDIQKSIFSSEIFFAKSKKEKRTLKMYYFKICKRSIVLTLVSGPSPLISWVFAVLNKYIPKNRPEFMSWPSTLYIALK